MSQYDEIKNLLKKSSALFGDQRFLKKKQILLRLSTDYY